MLIEENIKLFFNADRPSQRIYAMQGDDKSRLIKGAYYFNNMPTTISAEISTAEVSFKKPDGTKVVWTTEDVPERVFLDSDEIRFFLSKDVTAAVGTVMCDVKILTASGKIGTSVFPIVVKKEAVSDEDIISMDSYGVVEKMATQIQGLFDESTETISNINTAVTNANAATASAQEIAGSLSGLANTLSNNNEAWQYNETIREDLESQRIANEVARQTNTANVIADANAKIVDVETRFNNLSTAQQQDAEVILARGEDASLGDRLDGVDSSLAEKANYSDIADLSNATPIIVSSTANMTDTSKMYVLDSTMEIYQWVSGVITPTGKFYNETVFADYSVEAIKLSESVRDYTGMPPSVIYTNFDIGNVLTDGSTSSVVQYNNVLSNLFYTYDEMTIISTDATVFRYKIIYYNSNGVFQSMSAWVTSESKIPKGTYFRIGICLFTNLGTGVFTYSVEEMLSGINTYSATIQEKFSKLDDLSLKSKSTNYAHLSFDDTTLIFSDLVANKATYTSVFDNSTLAYYKTLHDTYGAVISLYCYLDGLASTYANLTQYKSEFSANSDWLKFGLHSPNNSTNYALYSYADSYAEWNNFVAYIMTFTGSYNCIDRIPRLHNFAGSKPACLGFRDANCGALGFLSADDARQTYYMTTLAKAINYGFTLESGSIYINNGNNIDLNTRLRTTVPIYLEANTVANINGSNGAYMINCTAYNYNGVFVSQLPYETDSITVPATGYYRFTIRTTVGTDDLSGSIDIISALLTITSPVSNFDQKAYLFIHDKFYDADNQLTFFRTDIRMESITDISATIAALSTVEWANKVSPLIMFTHEWQLSDSAIKSKLESCCQYVVDNRYRFDYPMYNS